MDKNNSAMKTVIAAGAASAFCGITLYAVGLEGESEEAKAEETEE